MSDRTLTDTEWADAQTVIAPAYRTDPAAPVYDPRIERACRYIAGMMRRDPADDRAATTTSRAAILLLADDLGGTPYRCAKCARVYYGPPEPADWELAGSADWLCWECVHTAAPEPKAIEAAQVITVTGRVRAELAKNPQLGWTAQCLADMAGCSISQARRALAELHDAGEAYPQKEPGTTAHMWRLTGGGA